ncbi:phosphoglycolate phosphatase 2 isoform X1 [Lactuca sativa]|uniref:phosphoglycolate phosphatase 2 isoform X1 n=1 Tax=Lactuca sativa TaxID=4236 RepID=UPI001C68FE66|nr:phosphoglycolate phosphatase 2 isoform X1 [Lactuca sativa]
MSSCPTDGRYPPTSSAPPEPLQHLSLLLVKIGAVVVGHDTNVNYEKIQYATLCIRENPRCIFIATNSDITINMIDLQLFGCEGLTLLI